MSPESLIPFLALNGHPSSRRAMRNANRVNAAIGMLRAGERKPDAVHKIMDRFKVSRPLGYKIVNQAEAYVEQL